MFKLKIQLCSIILILFNHFNIINCDNILNYDLNVSNDIDFIEQYKNGVESYLSNDWENCIDLIEKSLNNYHNYYNSITTCHIECEFKKKRDKPFYNVNINDLNYYESIVKKTLCIIRCKHKTMRNLFYYIMDAWARDVFLTRKPYEYLQLCYFKNGDITKAASAVYTLLMLKPNNKMMQDNFLYYTKKQEFNADELIDYEEKEYVQYYLKGVENYENENWQGTIDNMEKSLQLLQRNEDECRAFCEGEFDHGWHPDFVSSIANHFTYSLRCKFNCTRDINTLLGKFNHNLFATHYEYLQISYFKVNNLEEACKTASSYLLFEPTDEDMLSNIDFYKSYPNVKDDFFTTRNEAKDYVHRRNYEKKILQFIDKEFIKDDYFDVLANVNGIQTELEQDERIKLQKNTTKYDVNGNCPAEKYDMLINDRKVLSQSGVFIHDKQFSINYYRDTLENEQKLNLVKESYKDIMMNLLTNNNSKRFLMDNIISMSDCDVLMELAQMATINGDGYDGNINPHTKLEIFSGVTLGRVTLLSYFGIVDSIYLKVLLHSARIISEQLFYGFNIKRKLYFTYTHLMCRKSVTESVRESEFNKSSVNHQVHADNCLLNDNGKCLKELPAFYWRDFTTILFLNNNFDDGQFNFHQNDFSKSIQSSIQPKCGRLLGFKSGPSNVHSFNSIKNGIGCYIGIWFTFDKQHEEIDHLYANKILEQISLYGSVIDNFTRMYKN